ncbi:hypothetical protein HK100_006934 [Physocladia obscura]|uniref:Uncharacterized protein n=1 Tax=Physocladia obscura TaxID=109957 RepID=A0AAD5X780_9FUNG|nr:hypothetical protein HK100_006934 [Physocladia obscura]
MPKETAQEVERLTRILRQYTTAVPDVSESTANTTTVTSTRDQTATPISATSPTHAQNNDPQSSVYCYESERENADSIATAKENLQLRRELDCATDTIVSVVKNSAQMSLISRGYLWDQIRTGLEMGQEIGHYMAAVQSSSSFGSSNTSGYEDMQTIISEFDTAKIKLEQEQRAHKIVKRDMVALESNYTTLLGTVSTLQTSIKNLEKQCNSYANTIGDLELQIASKENELKISNEMLERARRDHFILNETFLKVSHVNEKNIQHLKESLGLHSNTASSAAVTITTATRTKSEAFLEDSESLYNSLKRIQELEAELRFSNDKYATDVGKLKNFNQDLQRKLQQSIEGYSAFKASGKTDEDWKEQETLIKLLENKNKETALKMSDIADTLETTALKYTVLSDNYNVLRLEMKKAGNHSGRLKSIIQAKDCIIGDLHNKTEFLEKENDSLKSRLRSAMTTASVKNNLANELKTKLDAVWSKISPIQKAASESDALRDAAKKLTTEMKHKEIQIHEWKRKFQKSLTETESRVTKLEIAIHDSLLRLLGYLKVTGRDIGAERGYGSMRPIGGEKGDNDNNDESKIFGSSLGSKMSKLSKEVRRLYYRIDNVYLLF